MVVLVLGGGAVVSGVIFSTGKEQSNCRLCPLVLIVKVGWKKVTTLGRDKVKLLGSGQILLCSRVTLSPLAEFQMLLNSVHDKSVPVTTEWRVLRLRMEERPVDMEGSCEYIEQTVASSLKGVVLQLGGWARC
jgi:hypothetical protein